MEGRGAHTAPPTFVAFLVVKKFCAQIFGKEFVLQLRKFVSECFAREDY